MSSEAELIAALPGLAFAFVLVLCRVSSTIALLPGLAETEIPMMVRAGLALAVTALLLPVLTRYIPPPPGDIVGLLTMVGAEVITGLWLGTLARVLVVALMIGMQVVSYMIGLSSALQPDPQLGPQTSVVTKIASIGAPMLLLASGLYAWPLAALAGSYKVIAPGALVPAVDATELVVQAVANAFALGMRLAGPFILANVVWHVAIGLLARLVPRLQVYFVSHPAQVCGGVLMMALLGGAVLSTWQQAVRDGFSLLPGFG